MADMQQTVPQVSGQWAGVAYVPRILRTMAEICEAMGVGQKTVKKWVAQGAPIAVEGDGNATARRWLRSRGGGGRDSSST